MTTTDDKELPLKNDIRLLGRLLGDTLRNQAGDAVFDLVERIRKLAIRYHRDDDSTARTELAALMTSVPREHTSHVVRAFSYFSHLTNIAEDQHHIRRARAHALAGSPAREGSLLAALQRMEASGISRQSLVDFFSKAQINPVLTAHPTEVQRKSILDSQWEISRLPHPQHRSAH